MRRLALFTLTITLTLACKTDELPAEGETGDGDAGDGDGDTGDGDGDTGDGPIGAACDPSGPAACELAGGLCCSDDPAALLLDDLMAQVTPAYLGRGGEGTPIFSGSNNPLSRRGMCVPEGSVAAGDALADVGAEGCPVPCNPNWSASDVESVCGSSRVCCQTVPLEPADCVLDPMLGDSGCWRPVTGNDITGLGGIDATNWASTSHATHQDPSGIGCQQFVAAIPTSVLMGAGITANDVLAACYRRLGVADQRGFCTTADAECPYKDPAYRDACETMNDDEGRTGC